MDPVMKDIDFKFELKVSHVIVSVLTMIILKVTGHCDLGWWKITALIWVPVAIATAIGMFVTLSFWLIALCDFIKKKHLEKVFKSKADQ
jgi:Sec-independent protein secretion pathway component TatC